MATLTLVISGMACGGCASSVAAALQALPGVLRVEVSHSTGRAEIDYDPAQVAPAQLKAAVAQAGYPAVD